MKISNSTYLDDPNIDEEFREDFIKFKMNFELNEKENKKLLSNNTRMRNIYQNLGNFLYNNEKF